MQKIKYLILLLLFIPGITFAAFNLARSNFGGIVNEIMGIIGILKPVLTGLAFVFFFWGLSKFILNTDKPEEIKKGKNYMMWGILALFILLTYTAIVGFISKELELGNDNATIPSLKTN